MWPVSERLGRDARPERLKQDRNKDSKQKEEEEPKIECGSGTTGEGVTGIPRVGRLNQFEQEPQSQKSLEVERETHSPRRNGPTREGHP